MAKVVAAVVVGLVVGLVLGAGLGRGLPIPEASAEGIHAPGAGFLLYAGPRRDTEKDESFIFYNPDSGDIWVYRDAKVKEHYRLSEIGQDLVELDR